MTDQMGDVLSLTTYDGIVLEFDQTVITAKAYGNFGAPPTEFQTRRGYKQDGVTEIGYTLNPRNVTIDVHRVPECPDRQAYWDMRQGLHDFLRPNRNGPLTLTLRTPGGNLRSLIVRAEPGFTLPPPSDNNWSVDEQLDFTAFDPIFFDSDETVTALTARTQVQLIFPITFSITFGSSDIFLSTGEFTYEGTWRTYPVIILTGPYTRAVIQNVQTGVNIQMNVAIPAGETRTIDLTPGSQTITDQNGNNRFSELGPGSNLVGFNLRPDPEVTDGIQEITAQFINGTVNSGMTLRYNNRYFAI